MTAISPPRTYDGLAAGPNWGPVANWSRSYSRQNYQFVAGASGNYFGNASARQSFSLIVRRFNAACTRVRIGWGAFAYGTDMGNDITIPAAVLEYPSGSGTFYPVTFSGSASGVVPNGGVLLCDDIVLPGAGAAAGDTFNIRTYATTAADTHLMPIYGDKWTGDKTTYGATVTDQTQTALASVTTSTSYGYGPCVILGNTPAPTIAILGDSIGQGTGDSSTGPIDSGWITRMLNNQYGILNACRHGETATQFFSGYMRHRQRMAYTATRAIVNDGNNDIHGGVELTTPQSAEIVKASLINIWRALSLRSIKTWQATVTPRTTSTDAWATTANQTVNANNGQRILLNQWLRDGAPLNPATFAATAVGSTGTTVRAGDSRHPLFAVLDVASLAETATDSGIWKAGYVSDGTHPNATGAAALSALTSAATFA